MELQTQLLCTFCTTDTLDQTIKSIQECYSIAFGAIYVLENVDEPGALYCTYNIIPSEGTNGNVPPSTISLHRKKLVNCLYTINSLNLLISEKNGGRTDRSFAVDWEELRNSLLVTQYGRLRKINTKIREVKNVEKPDAQSE